MRRLLTLLLKMVDSPFDCWEVELLADYCNTDITVLNKVIIMI